MRQCTSKPGPTHTPPTPRTEDNEVERHEDAAAPQAARGRQGQAQGGQDQADDVPGGQREQGLVGLARPQQPPETALWHLGGIQGIAMAQAASQETCRDVHALKRRSLEEHGSEGVAIARRGGRVVAPGPRLRRADAAQGQQS